MSEQGKHTAGPWRVDHLAINGEVVVRAADNVSYLCMIFGSNKERDARLIAAAPDMLAALKGIAAILDGLVGRTPDQEVNGKTLAIQIAAAIAKATHT